MTSKEQAQEKVGVLTRWYRGRRRRLFQGLDILGRKHGWVAVISRSLQDFFDHRMTLHAGNFAYSAFLALFPLILIIISVVGYLFHYDQAIMQKLLDAIKTRIPDMQATVQSAGDSIARLRGTIGVIGIIALLWTVSRITYALQSGFEEVWGMKKRSFASKRAFAFLLILLLLLIGVAALSITFLSTHLFSWLNVPTGPFFSTIAVASSHILSPLASFLVFAILYRTIPREKPGWKEIVWGALAMALVLDVFEYGLGIYFTKISRTQALYGSLGVTIGVVLWLYFVGIFIFYGAEIVQVLQKRWYTVPITMKAGTIVVPRGAGHIAPESDEADDE